MISSACERRSEVYRPNKKGEITADFGTAVPSWWYWNPFCVQLMPFAFFESHFFFCRVLKHYTIQYRFDVIIWTTQIYIVSAKYLKIDRIALAEHTAVVTGRHTGIFNTVIQRLTLPQRSSLNLHICLVAHYVLITFKLTVNMQFNFFFLQWYEVRRMFLNIFCLGCVTIHCIYSF